MKRDLQERGIKFIYETTVRSLEKAAATTSVVHFSDEVDAPFGAVMFATGRRANTKGLGLAEAGVELEASGAIKVDKFSRTNVPSIYAVGDVTGGAELTPVAIREGWYVAETLFNNNPLAVDHGQIGTAVFAEPEVGTIGLTETEAATHGDIDVYLTRFRPMINTLSNKPQRMMLKLITAAEGGKVLGLHILGPDAAELIQMAAIPFGMGADQGRFRPRHGHAPHRRRGTGDLQGPDLPLSGRQQGYDFPVRSRRGVDRAS